MKQQTALQFFLMGLVELEIGKGIPTDKQVELHKLFEQAKQMEDRQKEAEYRKGWEEAEKSMAREIDKIHEYYRSHRV